MKRTHTYFNNNIFIIILYLYLANVKNILKDVKILKLKCPEEGITAVTGKIPSLFYNWMSDNANLKSAEIFTDFCAIIRKSHFAQNCPIPLLRDSSFAQLKSYVCVSWN